MWHHVATALSRATLGDWALLAGAALLLFYFLGTRNYDYFRKQGFPSTRPRVPFAGDMVSAFLGMRPFIDVIKEQYKKAEGHGVYGFFQFTLPSYTVRDPELLKVIMVKEFDSFMNHQTVQSEKTDPLFGKNLFNIKDEAWRDMRATLSPAFTTSKLKGMFPLISQCGHQMVQHLRHKYTDSKEGAMKEPLPTDMKDLFSRVANDVIASVAFGVSCDSLKNPDNEFYHWGKVMTSFSKLRTLIFIGYIVIPKIMQVLRLRVLDAGASNFFDSLVRDTIRERQQKGIFRPDMLQLLMQARDGQLKAEKEDAAEAEAEHAGARKTSESPPHPLPPHPLPLQLLKAEKEDAAEAEAEHAGARKTKLTDEDISSQAAIFFLAGFETVSLAMSLTTHLLSQNEEVQKRLYAEVAAVMEETEGKPTYESVQAMKYLDAVLNETLRLYPPAIATDRVCGQDVVLPAGARSPAVAVLKDHLVSIPILGLHYDPEFWPDPERFDPERFSDENKHQIKPFTYMPFGLGPRNCIAQRFALMEVKLVLIHLLANFEVHPCSKTTHPLEFLPTFNFSVKGGFWCGIKPREL